MKIGILAGSVIPDGTLASKKPVLTRWGPTSSGLGELKIGFNTYIFIARHGLPASIPPHMVNHRANVQALADRGVEGIISICSTGALKPDIKVPGIAVPADFVDLFSGFTFFDEEIFHATPGLDPIFQSELEKACTSAGLDPLTGCVYVQTKGPRLETRSEVRLLSGWGDLVGMNLGPEAALCSELGIRSGALLTIDNHANGILDEKLDFRDILTSAKKKWDLITGILGFLPGSM